MSFESLLSFDKRAGGFPVPRIYQQPFESPPAWVMHWHWAWSSAGTLHILRPPPPSVPVSVTPALIEALARALVADVLADIESVEQDGEQR